MVFLKVKILNFKENSRKAKKITKTFCEKLKQQVKLGIKMFIGLVRKF